MKNITPYRMLGRANGIMNLMLRQYNLSLTSVTSNCVPVLRTLATRVNRYDAQTCLAMANAAETAYRQIENLGSGDADIRKEMNTGAEEAGYAFSKNRSCPADLLLKDYDFVPDIQLEREAAKRAARKRRIYVFSAIGAVILAVIIYNLPYFAETRAFKEAKKEVGKTLYVTDYDLKDYLSAYPDGRHCAELLAFTANRCMENDQETEALKWAGKCTAEFPASPYAAECEELYNRIWDNAITHYESVLNSDSTAAGSTFVVDMLHYMKDNHLSTLAVKITPTIEVKDFSDYSEGIRTLLKIVYNQEGEKLTIPEDLKSIRGAITPSQTNKWANIITGALQDGFNRALSSKIISVKDADDEDVPEKAPLAEFAYTVKNQGNEIPDIWTYTTNNIPQYYLFGLAIEYKAGFSIPGTAEVYSVEGSCDPGDTDIRNTTAPYNAMCSRSMVQMSERIEKEFGFGE